MMDIINELIDWIVRFISFDLFHKYDLSYFEFFILIIILLVIGTLIYHLIMFIVGVISKLF